MRVATRTDRTRDSPRSISAEIVRRWMATQVYPERLLQDVPAQRRGAVMELAYGTVRQFRALEFIRGELVPKAPARGVHAVLLVGLYQVFFLDREPPHAVVNETVEAAKRASGRWAGDLVNAVLRRALRERDALGDQLARQPLGVRLSHPEILVERWRRRYSENQIEALCEWNNSRPDVVVRVNRLRTRLEDLLKRMQDAGIAAEPHPYAPERCVVLPRGTPVESVPGYDEGLFTVQDPSTLESVLLLDPRPGECVLDLCAAPGGKTSVIVEQMRGEGTVVAVDPSAGRLDVLRTNLRRLGCDEVVVRQADATDPDALAKALADCAPEGFDRILLDVPCTNTGVLRRRPDARWRFDPERLRAIATKQRRLLDRAAPLLRDRGRIVYSTCSLEPEENEEQIESWLEDNSGFRRARQLALFPPESGTDGAYAALLEKAGRADVG